MRNETNQLALITDLVEKAINDDDFKGRLINNPKETIEEVGGVQIKSNFDIVVEDQSNDDMIYLNIPKKPDLDSMELSEEELQRISGGSSVPCGIGIGLAVWAISDFIDGAYDGAKDRLK